MKTQRRHSRRSIEALRQSLKAFGQIAPILVTPNTSGSLDDIAEAPGLLRPWNLEDRSDA